MSGTIDANNYTASLSAIRDLLKNKDSAGRLEAIGSVSVATMVPIIAVILMVSDEYGSSKELDTMIDRMMGFYHIGTATYKDNMVVKFL